MFASLGMLASCADDDLANGGDKSDGDKGTAVTFNVSDAQDDAQNAMVTPVAGNTRAFAGPVTRVGFANGLAMQGLTPEDLTSQKLPVSGADNACLIETTTAGVIPPPVQVVDAPQTRANITTTDKLPNFSTIGFRGTSSGNATTPWFHNADTKPNGALVTPIQWSWGQPYGKFFALAVASTTNPNAKPTLSPKGTAAPYVDFEVKPKVVDQEDLMTACSGEVHYATRFVAPTINLKFRHALTAVRFKVGQNLSWNKTITKVEITGAKSKGRYMLPTNENGTGARWTNLSNTKPFILGGDGKVNVRTSEAVNNIIVGKPGDNFTFYMIPQPLTGNNVQVKVTLDDGKVLTSTLSGIWKPGTTKTYALTENQSKWNYVLTVVRTNNNKLKYDQTDAGTYTVQSYRTDPSTGTQQPVKWKVVSYQESKDGGVTWGAATTVKPKWLSLGKIEGNGNYTTTGESGTATLRKDITDRLAMYNKVLRNAKQKGSAGSPYDLSVHNYKGEGQTMNTANSYLISAPGYYKIPLVYGNAIKNGSNNTKSYQTANSGEYILQKFKDHAGADITSPYINVQNSSKPATQASIVWTDQRGIVDGLSVTNAGAKSYVNFHVPADKIKNGNAVIAVKNASGTIMWSWHLWFDHKEVLETVKCTNFQGKDYNFTKQTLGFAYRKWDGSTYDKNRIVKVKFEQTIGQKTSGKQHATITIEQEPGSVKEISSTFYQFGRKDAFPGIDKIADGYFNKNGSKNMSVTNGIQHPEIFYNHDAETWYYHYNQNNLWSMNNITTGYNDNSVVKTIYDPCPAGFHIPASNAFTGFTKNGQNKGPMNVSGVWDYGWNFNNKIHSPDATVYFPAAGGRNGVGSLVGVGYGGAYWSASVPTGLWIGGCSLGFSPRHVSLYGSSNRSQALSVRPVSE